MIISSGFSILVIGIPEGGEKEISAEKIFEEVSLENPQI